MRAKDVMGRRGEELAARYLEQQGFAVLDRNWRCELGEVDIVARDDDTLVVCEVKTRSGTGFGTPLEAVTWKKASRLRLLAGRWLEEHDVRPAQIRIDVVGILARRGCTPEIAHVRAAA